MAALINFINDDDWTKLTVDGEDYYYYYYNYKLKPDQVTSKLLDKVTFNKLINASNTCIDNVEEGVLTRICNSNGEGYDGATYTLTLTVETLQYNKYENVWNADINILSEKPLPASQYLIENAMNPSTITSYNDENADKGKMFVFTHGEGDSNSTEARYIGDVPNNYVKFNCDDNNNCEVWRIIGVFDVEREIDDEENPGQKKIITEQRIKLVRHAALPSSVKWDTYDRYGRNDWSQSSLMTLLNGNYYNNVGNASTYGLKDSAREMINDSVFYLGALNYISSENFGSTEQIYELERGNTVCGSCNNDASKLRWQGNVALMYISDQYMMFAKGVSDNCYNNPYSCNEFSKSWGYYLNWFIISYSYDGGYSFRVVNGGGLRLDYNSNNNYARPVVYLDADVVIKEGTGEVGSPYIFK